MCTIYKVNSCGNSSHLVTVGRLPLPSWRNEPRHNLEWWYQEPVCCSGPQRCRCSNQTVQLSQHSIWKDHSSSKQNETLIFSVSCLSHCLSQNQYKMEVSKLPNFLLRVYHQLYLGSPYSSPRSYREQVLMETSYLCPHLLSVWTRTTHFFCSAARPFCLHELLTNPAIVGEEYIHALELLSGQSLLTCHINIFNVISWLSFMLHFHSLGPHLYGQSFSSDTHTIQCHTKPAFFLLHLNLFSV